MQRNSIALAVLLALLWTGSHSQAATLCAAGNPNTTTVAESTPTSAFTDNLDGTVTHNLTGLMWKQCAEGLTGTGCGMGSATTLTWAQALSAAASATFAAHNDWRLPNKKELESIVESCGYLPAINAVAFPATPAFDTWSSSTDAPFPVRAWRVNFNDGNTNFSNKVGGGFARLVRGGQAFDAYDAQPAMLIALLSVTSRKSHGAAGMFEMPIDPMPAAGGAVSVEPRVIGSGHTIVYLFNGPVNAAGNAGITPVGAAIATYLGNEVFVTLTSVPDNQRVTLSLANVNGSVSPAPISMGFLVGDVNNTRSINPTDTIAVKARSGQITDGANYRFDLNASGAITSSDILAVKARLGAVLTP